MLQKNVQNYLRNCLQVARCALARLYLMTDDLDQCQYSCMALLRQDSENEEATVMMADLAFRKNDYESAMFHFQQLLQKKPDYWVALARLVEVMRRTGHLEEVPQYLAKSEDFVGTRYDSYNSYKSSRNRTSRNNNG